MTLFLVAVLVASGAWAYWSWSRRRALEKLLQSTLSEDQHAIILDQVPLIKKLPPELRDKLDGKINLFLNEVEFVGCNGLNITEDMRLAIAAQACLLVVNNDTWYHHLTTILVYPTAFKSRNEERIGYIVSEQETVRSGESWSRGPVILSWADTQHGANNGTDGHNVVFHEFAHQLDDLSGRTNGIPQLGSIEHLKEWAGVFEKAYRDHVRAVEKGSHTVFDPYGAEGPQEFFAVAVEAFFETPKTLKHRSPAVYEQLAEFFRLDPAAWG